MINPNTIESNIYSILHLLLLIIQIYIFLDKDISNNFYSYVVILNLSIHGFWIRSMHRAVNEELRNEHPKLFYEELPFRGLYNIVISYLSMGTLIGDFIFSNITIIEKLYRFMMTLFIAIIMSPYLKEFYQYYNKMKAIRQDKQYKKLYRKIIHDKWEEDFKNKSVISNFLNNFIYTLIIFSLFIFLYNVYFLIYS